MAKYRRDQNEFMEHWHEQLNFIRSSIEQFDNGEETEARRIALGLRIMFHETSRSRSLIKQTGLSLNLRLLSSGVLYTPSNLVSSWVLLKLEISEDEIYYRPLINSVDTRTFYLEYEDWWNEVIFDDKNNVFSRKDIVCFIADQDGGAHVDPEIAEKYALLTRENSLGWSDPKGNPVSNNPAYNAVRQIAHEVLKSQEILNKGGYRKTKKPHSDFEMRFFDQTRRFKWSTTELNYSEETETIVNQYVKELRTLYNNYYPEGKVLEFIEK